MNENSLYYKLWLAVVYLIPVIDNTDLKKIIYHLLDVINWLFDFQNVHLH